MGFTKEEAEQFVDEIGICWLETDESVLYIAAVFNNKLKAPENFQIEIGREVGASSILEDENSPLIPKDCRGKLAQTPFLRDKIINESTPNKFIENTTSEFSPQHIAEHMIRPLVGGLKISSEELHKEYDKAGTLGGILSLKQFEHQGLSDYFAITNYHVVCPKKIKFLDPVFQPFNKLDDYTNKIGRVYFGLYGDHQYKGETHTLDVAFIRLSERKCKNDQRHKTHFFTTCGMYQNTPTLILGDNYVSGLAKATYGEDVHLHGLKSPSIHGKVRSSHAVIRIRDSYDSNQKRIFKNQILTDLNTQKGDSGSLLLNSNNSFIGLHHSGNGKGMAVASHAYAVFGAEYTTFNGGKLQIQLNKFIT